jgi:hypothetical protein
MAEEVLAPMHPQDNPGRSEPPGRLVPLGLPVEQVAILRDDLLSWLHGIGQDLKFRDSLRDPAATVREGEAFRRLLWALDANEIELPDEQAHLALERAARAYDRASGYSETVVVHDAHQALLGVLDPESGR